MKNQKKKYDYRKDIPIAVFNWMLLAWVLLFLVLQAGWEVMPDYYNKLVLAVLLISLAWFGALCFKGTRARFMINPRTDSFGWVMRTGKTLKYAVKRLARNYPILIRRIRLKDSTYKVTITKKYKYHPNPMSVEEVE
jgi:hypothetical protein